MNIKSELSPYLKIKLVEIIIIIKLQNHNPTGIILIHMMIKHIFISLFTNLY